MRCKSLGVIILSVFAIVSCVLYTSLTLSAQTTGRGVINGTVTDATGAVVPGVQITATNLATGVSRSTTSDAAGYYVLPSLRIGQYEITATHPGFATFDQKGVILDADVTVAANITLTVGATTQTITVAAEATTLHSETGAVNTLVSGTQVQELALNGRNFSQLLSLGPGVSNQQTGLRMGVAQEGNPLMSVNGSRVVGTQYTYDGILAMDIGGNRGLALYPPMEAIEEVQIHKSNYGADFGSNGYAQVNLVTKSGGDQYHGAVYAINGNKVVDARNFFTSSVSPFNQNMFGFTLGGPVFPNPQSSRHEKAFFFWSESWNRRVGPQVLNFTSPPTSVFTATTPTGPMRTGDFSALLPGTVIKDPLTNQPFPNNTIPANRINPNAALMLGDYYPLPNRGGSTNYSYSTDSFSDWREELGRVDLRPTEQMTIMMRFTHDAWHENESVLAPSTSVFPTVPGYLAKPGQNVVIGVTNLFGPHTVNQLTLGYTRLVLSNWPVNAQRPAGLNIPTIFGQNIGDVPPNISLSGYASLGFAPNNQSLYNEAVYRDDFSRQIGRHTLKVGTSLMRFLTRQEYPDQNQQGTFTFNGTATGNAVADLLLGDAYQYTEESFVPNEYTFASVWEVYVQDDWKVTPNLTLNIGLRDNMMWGAPLGREKYNNISDFVPGLYNPAAAPTLTSTGRLVAGTGDPLNGIITPTNQKGLNLPLSLLTTRLDNLGPRFGFAWSPFGNRKTVLRGGYGIFSFWDNSGQGNISANPPMAKSATVFNTSLSNPAQGTAALFPPVLNTEAIPYLYPLVQQYSMTLEREIPSGTVLSIGYVGNNAVHLDQSFNINQPQPNLAVAQGTTNLSTIVPYLGYGTITYDTRNASARYNALQLDALHRSGHGLTLEAAFTWSRSICFQVGQNTLLQMNEEALCSLDQPYIATFNYVYALPLYKDQKGFAGKVLGGWELSGITTYGAGYPNTVAETGNRSGTGNAGRPNLVGPLNIQPKNVTNYFNTVAFALQPLGQFGNEGAYILRGPGRGVWNMNLFKNFNLPLTQDRQAKLKIGGEVYNLFNEVSFSAVGTTYGSAAFGTLTQALDPRQADFKVEINF